MPIDENQKKKDLEKLLVFKDYLEPILKEILEGVDQEDLEFGYTKEINIDTNTWENAVEQNNYYSVNTDTLEHHDGVYLKATFSDSIENISVERYINIRSNAKIEISHRCFLKLNDNILAIVEKNKDRFKLTLTSE